MDERLRLARGFIAETSWAEWDMEPLAGDASARRYFRLRRADDSAVFMDAPPESGQDVGRFLEVAGFLGRAGMSVPAVLVADRAAGFAILEDFGDGVFARLLEDRPEMETSLYETATDVLVELDGRSVPKFVPSLEADIMAAQAEPAYEWYGGGIRAIQGAGFRRLQTVLEAALSTAAAGSPALLLRDYHSENLIWLPDREGIRRVGLLDFQDAMSGPPGYDLASLILDARRDVSPAVAAAVKNRFATAAGYDPAALEAALAVIGAQRNLRILGIFARLAIRSGKPRYLDFLPRVWQHVWTCLHHPSLTRVAEVVAEDLPEPTHGNLRKLKERCRQFHH